MLANENLYKKVPNNILLHPKDGFERCTDFLVRMIEKYGDELLAEQMKVQEESDNREENPLTNQEV